MEKNDFGVEITGDWEKLVEEGKTLEEILEESESITDEELEMWKKWRPKSDEEMEDMNKKAVEKVIEEAKIEEKKKKAEEDKEKAEDELGEAKEDLVEASKNSYTGFITLAKSLLTYVSAYTKYILSFSKKSEKFVINLISKYSPSYFETDEFNSSIQKKNNISDKLSSNQDGEEYKMKVNMNDKEKAEEVKEEVDKKP